VVKLDRFYCTWREASPSAVLFAENAAWTALKLNRVLHGEKPATEQVKTLERHRAIKVKLTQQTVC